MESRLPHILRSGHVGNGRRTAVGDTELCTIKGQMELSATLGYHGVAV
ncbi:MULTISPECIES: hypothetical protein [unclassified Sinorhizobium]